MALYRPLRETGTCVVATLTHPKSPRRMGLPFTTLRLDSGGSLMCVQLFRLLDSTQLRCPKM